MNRIITILTLLITFSGCALNKSEFSELPNKKDIYPKRLNVEGVEVFYEGISGKECGSPIKILGAPNKKIGVRSQYVWLNEVYSGAEVKNRGTIIEDDKKTVFSFFNLSYKGEEIYHCFDVSDYFFGPLF